MERTRTKSRMCNKILYFLHAAYTMTNINNIYKIKDYVSTINHRPANRYQKVVTDMK